jgi:hypothetical protein
VALSSYPVVGGYTVKYVKALYSDLALLATNTLSSIGWREYSLTVDTIKKQLPTRNKVSLALDRWTLTNKLAIISVIVYYMDRNWALCEVQLVLDEVDYQFLFYYKANGQ